MKICFLCSCFEPGRDGVGDYVRQFATQLANEGHECSVIALADRHAREVVDGFDESGLFHLIRIPFAHWAAGDIGPAERSLRSAAPDWLSLQMVSYGFDPRGLVGRSAQALARLMPLASRRHLMFHELWIGETVQSSIKEMLVGFVQKTQLLRATAMWSAQVVHTSNPVYRELLRRNGVTAGLLPLPGNIPCVPVERSDARKWLCTRASLSLDPETPLLAGVFGAVHPVWGESQWIGRLKDCCDALGRPLAVIHFGNPGSGGDAVWRRFQELASQRIAFRMLGMMPADAISKTLQALDIGIATNPWPLVAKSGSATAMLEHGLPVVVPRTDFRLRKGETPHPPPHPLLHQPIEPFWENLRRGNLARGEVQGRSASLSLFVESLSGKSLPSGASRASQFLPASSITH